MLFLPFWFWVKEKAYGFFFPYACKGGIWFYGSSSLYARAKTGEYIYGTTMPIFALENGEKPWKIKAFRWCIFFVAPFWRRRGDSNSCAGFPTYALSRGASSPTWVLLRMVTSLTYSIKMAERVGFEPTVPVKVRRFSRPFRYDRFGISP